ncbi:hypothetical protein WJX84_005983 [Apatococcus fuscideae]|uniref:Uncharacterized protein n=1 Tax=Apatococcus fuscideae TaxID=2026836 RepID=A0AAW1S0L5_9CHLO
MTQRAELAEQRQLIEARLQRCKNDWLELDGLQQSLPLLQGSKTLRSLVELGSGVYASTEAGTSAIFCNIGLDLFVSCSVSEASMLGPSEFYIDASTGQASRPPHYERWYKTAKYVLNIATIVLAVADKVLKYTSSLGLSGLFAAEDDDFNQGSSAQPRQPEPFAASSKQQNKLAGGPWDQDAGGSWKPAALSSIKSESDPLRPANAWSSDRQ